MIVSFFVFFFDNFFFVITKIINRRGYHLLKVDIFDHIFCIRSDQSVLEIWNVAFGVIPNSKDIVNFLSMIFCRVFYFVTTVILVTTKITDSIIINNNY
jgi:hypothetical protein